MKQLVVISGKGGTGKTTVSAALTHLAANCIVADCDVEAPNLHLLLDANPIKAEDFKGTKVCVIDEDKCIQCGECLEFCRFGAINSFNIQKLKCEGCGVCKLVCAADAIEMKDKVTGKLILSRTGLGMFSHAQLDIGADGSGKLVTEVRKQAANAALAANGIIIIDGSPGTGCPVIASVTGTDLVLVVTEPTISGLHDLDRVLKVVDNFGIAACACVNKWDLNPEMTREIEDYCRQHKIPVLGKIPHDPIVAKAQREGKVVLSYENSPAAEAIIELWSGLNNKLN